MEEKEHIPFSRGMDAQLSLSRSFEILEAAMPASKALEELRLSMRGEVPLANGLDSSSVSPFRRGLNSGSGCLGDCSSGSIGASGGGGKCLNSHDNIGHEVKCYGGREGTH